MTGENSQMPEWLDDKDAQFQADKKKVQGEINAAAAGDREQRSAAFKQYLQEQNLNKTLTPDDVRVLTSIVEQDPVAPEHIKKWDAIIARWQASPEGKAFARHKAGIKAPEQKSDDVQ